MVSHNLDNFPSLVSEQVNLNFLLVLREMGQVRHDISIALLQSIDMFI